MWLHFFHFSIAITSGGTHKVPRRFPVRDIIERREMSEYAVFRYFTNKQHLMATTDKLIGYLLSMPTLTASAPASIKSRAPS